MRPGPAASFGVDDVDSAFGRPITKDVSLVGAVNSCAVTSHLATAAARVELGRSHGIALCFAIFEAMEVDSVVPSFSSAEGDACGEGDVITEDDISTEGYTSAEGVVSAEGDTSTEGDTIKEVDVTKDDVIKKVDTAKEGTASKRRVHPSYFPPHHWRRGQEGLDTYDDDVAGPRDSVKPVPAIHPTPQTPPLHHHPHQQQQPSPQFQLQHRLRRRPGKWLEDKLLQLINSHTAPVAGIHVSVLYAECAEVRRALVRRTLARFCEDGITYQSISPDHYKSTF